LTNIKEDLADKFNADEYFDWAHDLLDAPESIRTTKAELKKIRDGRAEAQKQANEGDQMGQMASTGLDAAKAQSLLNPQ
jgi:hypothetical protein